MSPALTAAVIVAWIALAVIVTIVWGSICRTMGPEAKHDDADTVPPWEWALYPLAAVAAVAASAVWPMGFAS